MHWVMPHFDGSGKWVQSAVTFWCDICDAAPNKFCCSAFAAATLAAAAAGALQQGKASLAGAALLGQRRLHFLHAGQTGAPGTRHVPHDQHAGR